ncbi:MAG: phosphate acyltransferase PlsX, partial [Chloroflexi bacterium]|nr:phosphate acyltransferase PlsX [Chloroflexota bacterium]
MRIALDAMGGDHAPGEIVKGAVAASREYDINVVLVGKRKLIQAELAKHSPKGFILPIVDAEEVVSMHDPAAFSVRYKKESSIVVGINMVKTGQVSAFVSAGSTGAVTAASILMLGRVKGIDRPAISTVLPFTAGPLLLLDIGANPNCKPNYLVQFAKMGSVYMERVFGIDNPRVGLLNIGEEETKGNQITQEAHQLLKNSDINFIGNIESRQLTSGMMD